MGTLQLRGALPLDQFWPPGSSDADTAKVKVKIAASSFRFQSDASSPWRTTHIFDDAVVFGQQRKAVVSPDGHVTIRLQGIDAPELHYRPMAPRTATPAQRSRFNLFNDDYRQFGGESATVELHKKLSAGGEVEMPCVVQTLVDHPNDVFDTYGRMIGDILVQQQARELNVNEWALREGWALPSFYNSMTIDEIDRLTGLADQAFNANKGLWPTYSPKLIALSRTMIFRPKVTTFSVADATRDLSKGFILPKLFRRLCTYTAERLARMNQGTFRQYLQSDPNSDVHLMTDFRLQGATASPRHSLAEFLAPRGLTVAPEELVFLEKPSVVKSAAGVVLLDW